jgi:hypothetical protein
MFSGDDVYRPSYFEMVAADRLVTGLQPALKHICTVSQLIRDQNAQNAPSNWMDLSSEVFVLDGFCVI